LKLITAFLLFPDRTISYQCS